MRKFEILLVFCLAATFFQLSSIAQAQVLPKRYALLVGIAKYDADQLNQPQLKYPEADAREVGDRLKQGGYEVDLLLGPTATREAILTKLKELNLRGNAEGAIIIGLFGHGVEYTGTDEAMFCPYDTALRIARDADGKKLKDASGQVDLLEPDPDSLVGMSDILDGLKVSSTRSTNRRCLIWRRMMTL